MLLSAILATVLIIAWMFLFFRYRKQFSGMVETVDEEIFTGKNIYFIGLGAIELYENASSKKISESDKAIERMKHLGEIFGRDSAEMYYYVQTSAQISMILTAVPLALLLVCIFKSYIWMLLGIGLAALIVYSIQSSIDDAMTKKKDEILSEFPKMVSKLTMLINAGMLVRRAWDEVANSNMEHPLYKEMRFTSKDMQEGKSVSEAMQSFAERCGIKEMRKFASIYIQAINRGAADSIDSMKVMADEAWKQKKEVSKQKGEIAAQKLLMPNMVMFIGILAVVLVPIVGSMFGSF